MGEGRNDFLGMRETTLGLGIRGWVWSLKARIEALKGGGMEKKKKEEEKKMEEKISHVCDNIGHQPLWGRCPKM